MVDIAEISNETMEDDADQPSIFILAVIALVGIHCSEKKPSNHLLPRSWSRYSPSNAILKVRIVLKIALRVVEKCDRRKMIALGKYRRRNGKIPPSQLRMLSLAEISPNLSYAEDQQP